MEMVEIIVLTGSGDPAYEAAFNYFFSLMVNMGFIFIVPYACFRVFKWWSNRGF